MYEVAEARSFVSNALGKFDRGLAMLVRWMMYIGAGILFIWTCYMFLDVLLRYFFNRPLPNTVDYTQLVLVVLVACSVTYAELVKGHIYVDLVTEKLKPKVQLELFIFWGVIDTVVIGVVAWQNIVNAINYFNIGQITYGGIPLAPVTIPLAFSFVVLFILLARDLARKIGEGEKAHFGAGIWLQVLGLPLAILVVFYLMMTQRITGISPGVMGYLSMLYLLIALFLGQPLYITLLLCTMVLMGYSSSWIPGLMSVGATLFTNITSYSFSVVPLFILMGYIILVGNIGERAFWAAAKWVGHFRGGLAIAVVGASTALAACTGSGTASQVTMGLIGYPEMRKYRYDDGLSTGCICAGATLGPIIPPSMPMIIFGILTSTSIGKLFISGIIPGLLLALLFVIWILIAVRVYPKAGPAGEKASWRGRFATLPSFGPILALFLLVIGGLYGGVFTPTEGGAIGAIGALIISLALKTITWKKFTYALTESMKFIGIIYLMIMGGMALVNSFGMSGISYQLLQAIEGAGLSGFDVVVLLLFIYVIWGLAGDAGIIVILTVPVVAPILKTMGVDMIWFGLVTLIFGGMGGITPPLAQGIFMLRSMACPDVPLRTMFRGILPFCYATVLLGIACVLYPPLATWLPSIMK